MSTENKTAKAALKEAKDFITKKDFKSGLRCCKKALNVDKNNYMALVFCGLCLTEMQQPDQALQAYQRAVQSDPNQITGWQGLASFYEKQLLALSESDAENRTKIASQLSEVYAKMLALTKEVDKFENLSEKMVDLNLKIRKNLDVVVSTLKSRIEFVESSNDVARIRQAHAELVRVLNTQQIGELNLEQEETLLASLNKVINEGSSIQNLEHLKIKIKLLYKQRQMEPLCICAIKMHSIFPDNIYALEWICKIYLEWVPGTLDFKQNHFEVNPDRFINKLLALNPASTLAQLANGALSWHKKNNPLEASQIIGPILERTSNPNFFGVYILCMCLHQIQNFSSCERWLGLAPALLDKVKDEETRKLVKSRLDNMSIKTFYCQARFEKAAQILEQCYGKKSVFAEDESIETKILRAKIFARLGYEVQVEELLSKFDSSLEQNLVRAILVRAKKQFKDALSLVVDFLDANKSLDNAEKFEAMVLQGELLWDLGRYDESFKVFLEAANLNPNNWLPFLYLGRYYNEGEGVNKRNQETARKCFVKSFNINPRSQEAGLELSDLLREQGKWEENEKFLTSVSRQTHGATWANLRLGIHFLFREDPSRAILSLQSVLKTEPSNIDAWEILADAYFARGSLNAALRAYDQAAKLLGEVEGRDPNETVHARLQVATIKLQLGHHRDAIVALESIIDINNSYIPALKCLAEALVEEAKLFLVDYLNRKAVDNCQRAVKILTKIIDLSGSEQLCCSWKLLGDAMSLVECLPDSIATMNIPAKLIQKDHDEVLAKWDLLSLAAKCYARCLQIDDQNGGGWQDLALTYYFLAEVALSKDASVHKQFLRKSESCIRKAISFEAGNSGFWNLLGLVAFSADDNGLAQHAFIKSVTLDNNPVAWTNLGILYLVLGQYELANQAFKKSQNQDPSYLNGWVGQALLAEVMGENAESMDLFRHATFLGNELESSVGYANWICKTLSEISKQNSSDRPALDGQISRQRYCIEKMHGVSVGLDCLTRYSDRVRDDPCALNMWAVLLERQNLLSSARTALQSAAEIMAGKFEDKNYDSVHINLGRILYKLSDFEGSVTAFKNVQRQDFHSQVGLALASNKAGLFEQAYNSYQAALQLASDDSDRSHVLAAMATIAYKLQGGNAAKTLLFKATQLKPTSMDGLLALCILGIKESDSSLIKAALGEMEKRLDDKGGAEYRPDYISIKALTLVIQGKKADARILLCRSVHMWPDSSRMRRALALFYLHFENLESDCRSAETVARCAEIASGLGRNETDSVEMACLVGVARTLSQRPDEGLKAALKVAHTYPGSPQAWAVLVCAAFSTKTRLSLQTLERLVTKSHAMSSVNAISQQTTTSSGKKLESWISKYKEAFSPA